MCLKENEVLFKVQKVVELKIQPDRTLSTAGMVLPTDGERSGILRLT